MSIRLPQNPGIGGLDELTDAEELFIQNLAGLPYVQGDILFHDGTNLNRLSADTAGKVLNTNGAGANPSWEIAAGGGDMVLANIQTVTGAKTFNSGTLIYAGVTSGTIIVNATAIAGTNTLTLPAATDTLVGKATTDTFTNKSGNISQWTNDTGYTTNVGDALVANPLSQFATTTSAQLAGVISDETGSGLLVFGTSPTLVTPALGTPSALVGTNITGTASSLTAGTATALETARTINGVSFDGTANITVTAAAGTLTGITLNSTVVSSSLTSVGTIATGTWQGTTIAVNQGGTGQTTYTNGQLLIGNTTGNTLSKATLTQGTGITITNGTGTITIATTALLNVVEDTTPELGGELDAGAHTIGFTAQTATGDGATTIDWKLGNKFNFQFGAFNETFTFTVPTNPGNFVLKLVQDSVGSRTATWPATVKWSGGTAPTLTTTATTGTDIISFYFDGTNFYGGSILDFS